MPKTSSRRSAASRLLGTLGCLLCAILPALARGQVVISEIHYNPIEGQVLEFVEIHNVGSEPVDIGGWGLKEGVRYEFGPGATIGAGDYRVICRSRVALARRFGLSEERLDGEFLGALANGGERVELVDRSGSVVDSVDYDDDAPWALAADGGGPSLQRECADYDSDSPVNWRAELGAQPTPLAGLADGRCPPPPLPAPRVAINEIFYHESGDISEELEFVELLNTTDQPIDLLGWSFSQGFGFTFEESLVLGPGELVAVCRDADAVREAFDAQNVVGNFVGQLSNDGERITLVDDIGALVDSVRYRDSGDWPVAADGLGFGLERILGTAPSDDPASWDVSRPPALDSWTSVELVGRATSDRLLIYLGEAGEFLLDDVSLVLVGDPDEVELLPNGSFDEGLDPWVPDGNHEGTAWDPDGGPDGSGAMRISATGRGTGRTQGISVESIVELDRSPEVEYRLRFSYRFIAGNDQLTVRLSGASPSRGIYFSLGQGDIASPGARNGAANEELPPFVDRIGRSPREPRSEDPVSITARVRGESVASVVLRVEVIGAEPFELTMLDDGLAGDGVAGDGVYGVEVPPQPHGSEVTFRILADGAGGLRESPAREDPTGSWGYYVNDEQPESNLPIYTIVHRAETGANPRSLIAALNCATYQPASFAHRGDLYHGIGIRRRGQSVCGDGNVVKKYLKLKFQRGREFGGIRKLNFQSLWTDKSLIREHMAWETFESLGNPAVFHDFVRLHVNGGYFGLYARMQHPDEDFLDDNGLNADGNLYKAVASREERTGSAGTVRASYEKKTNEDGDFSDLEEFLDVLHTTPRNELVSFFGERTDEDEIIEYQLGQVLTNNRDYPHKNHYLYHDTARGKWMPITWDMDLTYGKRWDGNNRGVLNDLMDNPGISPWYTTNVRNEGLGNHLLDKFFAQAGDHYRRAYLVRLFDALEEKYTPELYEDRIVDLRGFLWDEQLEDFAAWGRSPPSPNDRNAPAEMDPNLDRVRAHIRSRRGYLLNYLQTREGFTGHDRLKITELMYNPAGGDEAGEFIELWNNSGRQIDVSGWTITGLEATLEDGTRVGFVFPEGSLIAADEVFCVVKDPFVFELRYGSGIRTFGPYPGNLANTGEELRVRDAGPGHPATVDWLRWSHDPPWPIRADGLGYSLELTDVSVNRDNDLASNWRDSVLLGGTPGEVEGITFEPVLFSRGDCDADGAVRISDAVELLFFLFRGQESVPCQAACDADGDTSVTITDAVFLLDYLFRGAGDVIPSPGPGECGPAGPVVCEVSNCSAGA